MNTVMYWPLVIGKWRKKKPGRATHRVNIFEVFWIIILDSEWFWRIPFQQVHYEEFGDITNKLIIYHPLFLLIQPDNSFHLPSRLWPVRTCTWST